MPPKFKFTRQEIIDTAFALVRKKGWDALSTRAVAACLGTSARPIYSFFASMDELDEALVKKGVDLLYGCMTQKFTNDPWHDHGIGYVRFAMTEKHLFTGMTDGRRVGWFKKYGDIIWENLTRSLKNYPPFQNLSQEEIYQIQLTRWLFAHGLAFQACNPPEGVWSKQYFDILMQQGSEAILAGWKVRFASGSVVTLKKGEKNMAGVDPRKMALQIAGLRAAESLLPKPDRVFYDPYAIYFFDKEDRKQLQTADQAKAQIASYNKMMPGVNGAIVTRIRFIDEVVDQCLSEDFQQMVIIGAGYDTRAYRIQEVSKKLKVFEVDHPLTGEIKKKTIAAVIGKLPGHVTYVPVVFGQERMDQKLMEHGFQQNLKTLFIAEGLLMYIPPQAVDGLLAFITAASLPDSIFVADYFLSDVIDGTSLLKEARVLRQFVENEGSTLKFGIKEGTAQNFFIHRGFYNINIVPAPSLKQAYFRGDSTKRPVSSMFYFVKAAVAP
jgi:methyltransferase (TIGR00027 family)